MVAYLHGPNLANSNPNKQWSGIMKRRIKKRELFRKIFAKRRIREDKLEMVIDLLIVTGLLSIKISATSIAKLLSQAAPVALDLGNGWIECSKFGKIHPKLNMISYRPKSHRSDCTALQGGISLPHIKRAKLI
jgi:hypothetical protein